MFVESLYYIFILWSKITPFIGHRTCLQLTKSVPVLTFSDVSDANVWFIFPILVSVLSHTSLLTRSVIRIFSVRNINNICQSLRSYFCILVCFSYSIPFLTGNIRFVFFVQMFGYLNLLFSRFNLCIVEK